MKKYSEMSMVGGLIMIVISILVAIAVIPTVANQERAVSSTYNSSPLLAGANVTGAPATLLDLTPLLFVAFIIIALYKTTVG